MRQETVRLFGRVEIPVRPVPADASEAEAGRGRAALLNTEIAGFGYSMQRALFDGYAAMGRVEFAEARRALVDGLGAVSGATSRHAVLLGRFPYEKPGEMESLHNWVLAAMRRDPANRALRLRIDPNGAVVDVARAGDETPGSEAASWIAYLPNMGLDEMEALGDGLETDEEIRHAFERITPLKPLLLADGAWLGRKAGELLVRGASLSEDERLFLRGLAPEIGHAAVDGLVASGTKPYRENLPVAYRMARDPAQVAPLVGTAVDVLRIAAGLSADDADLSLAAPVRFRLSTSQGKGMLRLLEGLGGDVGVDMLRHRERWLRLGERLHPGSASNRVRFPRAAPAFARLRREPALVPSFNREVERSVRARAFDAGAMRLLASRPGELMRRLDTVLRSPGSDHAAVLEVVRGAARGVQTPMLMGLWKYLGHRAETAGLPEAERESRVFLPKGRVNRMKVLPDRRASIPVPVLEEARAVLLGEIHARAAMLPPLGHVYVDPALAEVAMPFNRRGDSKATGAFTKGSRYPVGDAPVIRMFLHWTGNDVDLSTLLLNERMERVDQVSYTETHCEGAHHSGDVRSAPNGASEFIDLDVDVLLERGIRYAVMSVIAFSDGSLKDFPCYAGTMGRDVMRSGARYEPASVAVKFELESEESSAMPLILDLVERKMVYADISSDHGMAASLESMGKHLILQASAAVNMTRRKPTAMDVVAAHVAARGTRVDSIGKADTVFMAGGLDMEAIQTMLSMPTRAANEAGPGPAPAPGR